MDMNINDTSSDVVEQDWDVGRVTVEYDDNQTESQADGKFKFSWKRLAVFAGPGMLVAIAYVDPGNLESDLQTGVHAGYKLGWLFLLATAVGCIVQLLASRLGVVMGKDMAQSVRAVYPRTPRLILWAMTELAIIGADIQEVIGTAIAIEILSNGHVPLWGGVVITAFDTFLLLFLQYLGVRKLEAFFAGLVSVMAISFGVIAFKAHLPAEEVVLGVVVPRFKASQLTMVAGIIGCLVMPHNIFLHSALVQTRKLDTTRPGAKREAIVYNGVESGLCAIVTVFINLCVMAVFAKGFYGLLDEEKEHVGLSTAGQYLGDTFGGWSKYVWGVGLLAAGQSSTMTGTYTGQFVMTGFLNLKIAAWKRAILTRSIALVPALVVAIVFAGTNGLDKLNQGLNVLQSIQLPFALLPLVYITTRGDLMGTYVVRTGFRALAFAVCVLLLVVNGSVVVTTVRDVALKGIALGVFTCAVAALYTAFVTYLIFGPRVAHRALVRLPGGVGARLARVLGDDGTKLFCGASLPPPRAASGSGYDSSGKGGDKAGDKTCETRSSTEDGSGK